VIKNGFLVVQPGDSLSIIAGDIYGNQQAYNRIFEANQKLLSDPNMLQAGESIFIPIE
jgi:nucleoid-associated protein YgaU